MKPPPRRLQTGRGHGIEPFREIRHMGKLLEDRLARHVNTLPGYREYLESAWFDVDDADAESPPCTEACPCPRCRQADEEERALSAFEQRTEAA